MTDERTEAADHGTSPFQEVARAHALAERAAQGLGPTLVDPAVIERLATLLDSGRKANDIPKLAGGKRHPPNARSGWEEVRGL